jgi:hypothetical protein
MSYKKGDVVYCTNHWARNLGYAVVVEVRTMEISVRFEKYKYDTISDRHTIDIKYTKPGTKLQRYLLTHDSN